MKEKKYTKECADGVIKSLGMLLFSYAFLSMLCGEVQQLYWVCLKCPGLDHKAIDKCIGDPDADKENPVLKAEQDAQVTTYML